MIDLGTRVYMDTPYYSGIAVVMRITEIWCCGKRVVEVKPEKGGTFRVCQSVLRIPAHAAAVKG